MKSTTEEKRRQETRKEGISAVMAVELEQFSERGDNRLDDEEEEKEEARPLKTTSRTNNEARKHVSSDVFSGRRVSTLSKDTVDKI